MVSFWKHVNGVLRQADLIIEVLDSRMIEESRNYEIEEKIKRSGKQILYVINKCDLVDAQALTPWKKILNPCIFISSRYHLGTTLLKKKILEISKGEQVIVGVVGYPNVGKSSLINALAGRSKARTSPQSGFTKGMQKIKVDSRIELLDTPGVLPDKEKDMHKHMMIGAIDHGQIKDPETAALGLIQHEKEAVLRYYQIEGDDPEEILEKIALKLKKVIKGGEPDIDSVSRLILKSWQLGKIRRP